MKEFFSKYGFNINEEKLSIFKDFYNFLIENNKKFNLTAITEEKEVYIKHFIDSLSGEKYINGGKVIDIGSGGGFPAVPIKILREDIYLTMLEATGKKCEYLKTLCDKLELKNVSIINGRAEEYAIKEDYRESFNVCTARAVASLNILSEYCLPFVKVGGIFIAYKGDADNEIKEAENAIKTLGGEIEKIIKFDLEGAKRTLVIIKKIKTTEKKYPRLNGKIRKNPL